MSVREMVQGPTPRDMCFGDYKSRTGKPFLVTSTKKVLSLLSGRIQGSITQVLCSMLCSSGTGVFLS